MKRLTLTATLSILLAAGTASAQHAVTGVTNAELDAVSSIPGFIETESATREVEESAICIGVSPCVFEDRMASRTAAQSYLDRRADRTIASLVRQSGAIKADIVRQACVDNPGRCAAMLAASQ